MVAHKKHPADRASTQLCLRLVPRERKRLEVVAKYAGISMTSVIRQLIQERYTHIKKEKKC